MKYLICFAILSVCFPAAYAQDARHIAIKKRIDSMKMEGLSTYAKSYPQLRQAFIAMDFVGSSDNTGKLNDQDIFSGETNIRRIRSAVNLPVSEWGKNRITGTMTYQQTRFETKNLVAMQSIAGNAGRTVNKATVGLTATFSRTDSIFNIPFSYSGSLSGITDELTSVKRINYLGSVTFPVSRSQNSSLTLGLVVIIDPSSVAPVVPVISYWRKIKSVDLDLYADLPSRIILRKQFTPRAWFNLGSELGGTLLFFGVKQPGLPQNNILTNVVVRSGGAFEYQLTKKVIVGVNGGLYSTTESRMFDHHDQPKDKFYSNNGSTVPFLSFSVSLLPFIKSL